MNALKEGALLQLEGVRSTQVHVFINLKCAFDFVSDFLSFCLILLLLCAFLGVCMATGKFSKSTKVVSSPNHKLTNSNAYNG